VLWASLNNAVREELISRNVAALIRVPKPRRRKVKPWSADEVRAFLESARKSGDPLYAAYVLILVLGLRRGEVLGLRWEDTVDGLIYAGSMVMLDSARRETPVPALARWLLSLGIAATLAANVAHGRVVEHGNDVTSSQAAASAAFLAARRRFATYRSGRTEFSSNASSVPASAQDVVAGCVTDGRVLAAAHAWWPDEVAGASL
jgi:hypothetical protein